MSKTVPSLVLSDFEDATTGDRFAKGDKPTLERGAFDNFEAAGLVRKADPAPAPSAAHKPAQRRRPPAAK